MVSFATPTEMEQRSQGAITAAHPFLQKELDAATAAIREYCRWHIAKVEQLQYRRTGAHSDPVWLPAMRISSIEEALIDGMALAAAGIEFDVDTGWTPLCGRRVDIKFTAGFTTVPSDLVTLTLELAAAALGSPLGISREQAGGVSVTFTRTSGALLVQPGGADVGRLAPYRLGVLP